MAKGETPPVSPCELLCAILRAKTGVLAFAREIKCEPFVREVEKRNGKQFKVGFVTVTFWQYLRERFWAKSRTLQEVFSSGGGRLILVQTGYNLSSCNLIWDTGRIGLVVFHNDVNDGDRLPAGVAHRCHIGVSSQRRIVKHRR